MNYEIKIRNHQKLNREDIRAFCITVARQNNLSDYVTELVFIKIWDGLAAYDEKERKICIDNQFLEHYKEYKKTYKFKRLLDRILVLDADVFNIFIISTIFHEMHHAMQEKAKESDPFSPYEVLLQASYLFASKSGTTYKYHHDRYFYEYDAIINELRLTLDYIGNFNLDKRAIFLLNRSHAERILSAYGVPPSDYLKANYNSPIAFFKFFFDDGFPIYESDKPFIDRLESSILSYQPESDIDAFLRGFELPDFILEKLSEIVSEKINTVNIFEELFPDRERKV